MISTFNDSYKEYYKIIEKAQTLNRVKIKDSYHENYIYYEEHHIIPKSLGGSNGWRNLVLLTPEEHYICHSLLPYFCEGKAKAKMTNAWHALNMTNKKGLIIIGAKKFGNLRKLYSKTITGANNPNARSVYQIDINSGQILEKFDCIKDAEDKTGANHNGIIRCCQCKLTQTSGFIWIYSENYSEEKIKDLVFKAKNSSPKPICQLDIDTGHIIEIFKNAAKAAKKLKLDNGAILNRCNGKTLTTKSNFDWCFLKDYNDNT